MNSNGHVHGACVRCGIEEKKFLAAKRVLEDGMRMMQGVLINPTVDERPVKIWVGRARRASKGQSVYSEHGRIRA